MTNNFLKLTHSYNFAFSFVIAGFSAFFPSRTAIFGIPLDKDLMVGNVNFFKASEGYLESFPQAVYQLSIALREGCDYLSQDVSLSSQVVTTCGPCKYDNFPNDFYEVVI